MKTARRRKVHIIGLSLAVLVPTPHPLALYYFFYTSLSRARSSRQVLVYASIMIRKRAWYPSRRTE